MATLRPPAESLTRCLHPVPVEYLGILALAWTSSTSIDEAAGRALTALHALPEDHHEALSHLFVPFAFVLS
jgi:hypothetical protein